MNLILKILLLGYLRHIKKKKILEENFGKIKNICEYSYIDGSIPKDYF